MSTKPAQVEEDEFAALKGPDTTTVTLKFPTGTDPKIIEQTMKSVTTMAKGEAARNEEEQAAHALYAVEGKRRWKCTVHSLREGWRAFECTVAQPSNVNIPVVFRGRCGRVIEDGLPQFAIDCIQNDHSFRTEALEGVDPRASLAITTRQVLVPHYRVEIHGEVKNPKPILKKGR